LDDGRAGRIEEPADSDFQMTSADVEIFAEIRKRGA